VKAVIFDGFGGPEVLREREVVTPRPGPLEVTIDVEFAAVGLIDVLFRRGDLSDLVTLPFIPGIEVAGTVRELGNGDSGLRVGDRVVTLSRPAGGGYAEVAVSDAALAIPLDATVDLALAVAAIPNLVAALGALELAARIKPGESVLVLGATGGLASAFPLVARSMGAGRIVGSVSTLEKRELLRSMGFDDGYLNDELPLQSERFDLVVDAVGGKSRTHALGMLRPMGRLLAVGNASGTADVRVDPNELWLQNTGIVGFNVGGLLASDPSQARALGARAASLLADGNVSIPLEMLRLDQAEAAHRLLESRTGAGKVILSTGR
jgi:NADPH2:quinone reductase